MATGSFIGWIDMRASDLELARDYLRRLEEGTVDELGFGIVRDHFSERFFPATSTVMSIARQYVLVPFCCLHLADRIRAERGWSTPKAVAELHALENHLRLRVTGYRKEDVLRQASTIYWPALRKLRVFEGSGAIASYLRHVVESAGRGYRDDDGMAHLDDADAGLWDPDLLRLYAKEKDDLIPEGGNRFGFRDPDDTEVNGRLTASEARYLRDVYRRHQAEHGPSIMSHVLDLGIDAEFAYPWEAACPDELRDVVDHAQRFSMVAAGARLVYARLLLEEREHRGLPKPPAPDYRACFSTWWRAARDRIRHWDLDAFKGHAGTSLRRSRDDEQFLALFQAETRSYGSAASFFDSPAVHEMVARREKRVRPQKSRLRNPKYLEQWKPFDLAVDSPGCAYGLDFRADKASGLCTEILQGLRRRGGSA